MEGPTPGNASAPSEIVSKSKPKRLHKSTLRKSANKDNAFGKEKQKPRSMTRKSGTRLAPPCKKCRQEGKREKTLKFLMLSLNRLKKQSARTFCLMECALDALHTDVSGRQSRTPKLRKGPATETKTRKSHSIKPAPGKMAAVV